MSFVHTHNHTNYSLLDGLCKIPDMFALAKEYNMPALALTDHGVMFGAIEFYEAGMACGVKPIIGLEAYIAPGLHTHKAIIPGLKSTSFHVILLAQNAIGYHNLCKLSTLSYKEGYYYKPRISLPLLKEYSEGLVCSTACLQGELAAAILGRHFKTPDDVIKQYLDIFDKDHFYLEIHDHAIAEESTVRRAALDLATKYQIRIVAAQDTHYLKHSDAKAHEVLLCVQTSDRLSNPNHFKYTTDQLYFRTADEMKVLFGSYPGAIENTLRIADMCSTDLGIGLGKLRLPVFTPVDGSTPDVYLENLAKRGFRKRYPGAKVATIERLNYELGVIKKANFSSYFLVVQDIVNWAKRLGIFVGPGRGSAAGSIVSYCLGITDIDPIQHNLMFERFLNPDRISMPDIDLDFADDRRQEVVAYITNKYGADRVSQIVTFGTLNARSAVRDVARVLDLPYEIGDTIAKAIPEVIDITIEQAMELSPSLRDMVASPNLPYAEIIQYAKVIEGAKRQSGVHAAGVVVASEPLFELLPMYRAKNKEMATQLDMYSVDKLGLLKIDVLGLKTLRVMADTLQRVTHGIKDDYDFMVKTMRELPLDLPDVLDLFAKGKTVGIFQFESTGMQSYLKQIGVKKFEDLVAMNSLYRPGAIDSGMIDTFVHCRTGKQQPLYLDTRLEPILKETEGVGIYQEQVMSISRVIANYTLAEADTLRKAMGKKIKELMAANEEQFISRAIANNTNELVAREIWRQIETFARYGFNKCVAGDTLVYRSGANQYGGKAIKISDLYKNWISKKDVGKKYRGVTGVQLMSKDIDGNIIPDKVISVYHTGRKDIYRMTLCDGKHIDATAEHNFLTSNGWKKLSDINIGDSLCVTNFERVAVKYNVRTSEPYSAPVGPKNYVGRGFPKGEANPVYINGESIKLEEYKRNKMKDYCEICGKTFCKFEVAHIDGNRLHNDDGNLNTLCLSCHKKHDYRHNNRVRRFGHGYYDLFVDVKSIKHVGPKDTYDIEMEKHHNYVANGIVTHNSHSTGYAYLAYLTAWMKTSFPEAYMAALISSESDSDSLKLLFAECKSMGIKIELPDVNLSELDFSDAKSVIRFGLRSIKGVGDSGAMELTAKRADRPYANLHDLCARCDLRKVHKGVMRALIESGALDSFGETRDNLLYNLDKFMSSGAYKRKQSVQGQVTVSDILPSLAVGPLMDKVESAPLSVKLRKEYELLGVYVSGHPLDTYDDLTKQITNATTTSYACLPDNSDICLLGIVREIVKKVNRRGDPYMIVRVEDKNGLLGTMVRGQQYKEYDGKILIDEVYVLSGGVQKDKKRPGVSWVSIDRIVSPDSIVTSMLKPNKLEGSDYVWEVAVVD